MLRFTVPVLAMLASPVAMAAEPVAWAPTAAEAALVQALSLRDGSPPCRELEALVPAPVASLQAVVHHVTMPPWVGMRAASCLITGHATETRPALELWVTDPELRGLGILVLGSLDTMPVELATDLATRAIQRGADPADARRRVARSTRPEIAALATLPDAAPVAP